MLLISIGACDRKTGATANLREKTVVPLPDKILEREWDPTWQHSARSETILWTDVGFSRWTVRPVGMGLEFAPILI